MKVSIIGGGGRVGSNAAFALQQGGIVREIVIVDAAQDMAEGEALDLRHGASLSAPQIIRAGGYDAVAGSDCVVITAGLRRKPDETRLDLISRNVELFNGILDSLMSVKLAQGACILVVSNPVDILTQLAFAKTKMGRSKVFGLGTVLDTCRFRSFLGEFFNVAATDVKALILGEHGDSMVPIWSSATINGVALSSFPGYSPEKMNDIFEMTKTSGAEVIRQKGGAGWAVGVSIREVVEAVALDKRALLPISVYQEGALGIRDVCLSLPTIVDCSGAASVIEPSVSDSERELLLKSAESLRDVLDKVL
ncbi:MAG: lactate/malate dehydrogenase family protein [Fimbriimonadia bacterium]|jgi:L-lactate dehydrogenase